MLRSITVDDLHDIVEALSTALDAKSVCMCGHSERVAEISRLLAKAMRLSPAEQTRIHIGAHLHDVGKIGIPDAVLSKPGKLTAAEYNIIRQHPEIGASIVGKVKALQAVVDIVRNHHERATAEAIRTGRPAGISRWERGLWPSPTLSMR